MSDRVTIETVIRGYTGLPFETQADIDEWFNPLTEWQMRGNVLCRVAVGPARMSEREKARYLASESHNILTNNGKSQVLTYIGTNGAYTSQFGNILSLGSGSLSAVNGSDITIPGEYYRQSVTTQIYSGSLQVDMQTTITGTNGDGTITSIGIWGNGATTTLGTGTLLTHALINLVKSSGTSVIDYIV